MKYKLFFSTLLLIAAAFTHTAKAQNIEFIDGKSQNYFPESSGFADCQIYMKNTGTSAIKIVYEKVSADYPSAWDVSFCDNRNCFFAFRDKDTFAALASGEKASMKISVFPKGKADTAVVKYAVWDINNPSQKDTLVFNIFVRWSLGGYVPCASLISVYPVPAHEQLNVSGSGFSNLSVYSTSGVLLKTISSLSEVTTINIADLPLGYYILGVSNEKQSRQIPFIKN